MSDYLDSNRDHVTDLINELTNNISDYSKNTNDSGGWGTAKEIHSISSMLNNGMSMNVTINAEGVGNIATAVANCHAKSSSDAGTNG